LEAYGEEVSKSALWQTSLTSLAGDPAGAGGNAGRKVKLSWKIELVEKPNRRVAVLSLVQWLWASDVQGYRRRAPKANVILLRMKSSAKTNVR